MNRSFILLKHTLELYTLRGQGAGAGLSVVTETSRLHSTSISTGLCCSQFHAAYLVNSTKVISLCLLVRNSP